MTNARRRTLLLLGSAALIFGLLSGYAVWRRAAEGGYARAASNLAQALERGEGCERDAAEAARWRRVAETTRGPAR